MAGSKYWGRYNFQNTWSAKSTAISPNWKTCLVLFRELFISFCEFSVLFNWNNWQNYFLLFIVTINELANHNAFCCSILFQKLCRPWMPQWILKVTCLQMYKSKDIFSSGLLLFCLFYWSHSSYPPLFFTLTKVCRLPFLYIAYLQVYVWPVNCEVCFWTFSQIVPLLAVNIGIVFWCLFM